MKMPKKAACLMIAAALTLSVSAAILPGAIGDIPLLSVSASANLSKDASGSQVTEMQSKLAALNYIKSDGVTGYFDQNTESAVKTFQSEYGISADGVAGANTVSLLNGLVDGTAHVLEVNANSVNIRTNNSVRSSVLTVAKKGQRFEYLSYSVVDGVKWYKINIKNNTGYICGTYISIVDVNAAAPSAPASAGSSGKLTIKGTSVNVRKGAGTKYAKVATVKKGQSYSYSKVQTVSGVKWYYIKVNSSKSGWISGSYVTVNSASPNTASQTAIDKLSVKGTVVNVRSGADVKYAKISTVKKGQTYSYFEVKNGWYRIQLNSSTGGWISGEYVTATPNPTATTATTTAASATTTAITQANTSSNDNSSEDKPAENQQTETTASTESTAPPSTQPTTTTTAAPVIQGVKRTIGYVKVSQGSLYVRKGAGTSYAKLGALKNGTKVIIVSKGASWHKIIYGSGYGYVSASYITNITTSVEPVDLSYSVAYHYITAGQTVSVPLTVTGATVTYSSSDAVNCPVTAKGVATGKTPGLYDITATCGTAKAVTSIVVLRSPYSGIQPMKISAAGTKFIADWEGGGTVIASGETVYYPYKDVSGYWTVGYGHAKTTAASKSWSEQRAIAEFNKDIESLIGSQYKMTDDKPYLSQEAASKLLNADLNKGTYVSSVSDWAVRNGVKLTQSQFDALVSFCYNLGSSYWTSDSTKFYLKSAIICRRSGNDAKPDQIIEGFCRYMKSSGKSYKGLWYRRRNEAEMFLEGDYAIDRDNKFTLPSGVTWA